MTEPISANDTDRPAAGEPSGGHEPVPAVVDWVLGILTGIVGFLLTATGGWLFTQVDRATISDVVRAEGTEVEGLTEAEAITAAGPFVDWVAAGIAVTGLVFVAAGAAFVLARRRTRRRVEHSGGTTATFWACAVYGGAATTLVSFIPGAAVAGGGVAAYLRDDGAARIGAASGLVVTALTAPFLVFLAVAFLSGAGAVGELAGGAFLAAIIVGSELLAVGLTVALGALGGFLVARYV